MTELIFTGNDLLLIESLAFNPSLEPSYELLKGCLIWEDESPPGLTPKGYEALCDLWIARSFLHRDQAFSEHPLDPVYFEKVWERALSQGFSWPGFKRLTLSEKDKRYYDEARQAAATAEEY